MENLDAGKALQGGFYAVYDVHLAILPTAAGVGMTDIPPPPSKLLIMELTMCPFRE